MRFYCQLLIMLAACLLLACSEAAKPSTPFGTLEAYTKAIKKKDTTQMKLLLSQSSLKMAEQEAKAQNVALDEVIKRETLFSENQTSLKYKNEKINGEKATIEMLDSFETWNTVPFIREDGIWKIDKQGIANQMVEEFEQNDKELERIINQGRQP